MTFKYPKRYLKFLSHLYKNFICDDIRKFLKFMIVLLCNICSLHFCFLWLRHGKLYYRTTKLFVTGSSMLLQHLNRASNCIGMFSHSYAWDIFTTCPRLFTPEFIPFFATRKKSVCYDTKSFSPPFHSMTEQRSMLLGS